jgi:hypothetical protein
MTQDSAREDICLICYSNRESFDWKKFFLKALWSELQGLSNDGARGVPKCVGELVAREEYI